MPAVYTLSEEIARYHVEIIFQNDKEWQVCFSNPTAGPWKLIKIGGYIGDKDLRYTKEEDRPDVILFCRQIALFIIVEAKDSLNKFISGGHATGSMRKSLEVFQKEMSRVDRIMSAAREKILGPGSSLEHKCSVGYLFPTEFGTTEATSGLSVLFSEHQKLVAGRDSRLKNCLVFLVGQDSSYSLHTQTIIDQTDAPTTFPWVSCLPAQLAGNVRQLKRV